MLVCSVQAGSCQPHVTIRDVASMLRGECFVLFRLSGQQLSRGTAQSKSRPRGLWAPAVASDSESSSVLCVVP